MFFFYLGLRTIDVLLLNSGSFGNALIFRLYQDFISRESYDPFLYIVLCFSIVLTAAEQRWQWCDEGADRERITDAYRRTVASVRANTNISLVPVSKLFGCEQSALLNDDDGSGEVMLMMIHKTTAQHIPSSA